MYGETYSKSIFPGQKTSILQPKYPNQLASGV